MKLEVKDVNLNAGGTYIVILNQEDAAKRDINALDRVKITAKNKELIVLVNISNRGIRQGQIGLYTEVLNQLKLKNHDTVHITPYQRPLSVWSIKKKLDGKTLSTTEINSIVQGIVNNSLTTIDLTYFISGVYTRGFTLDETTALTEALVHYGGSLPTTQKMLLDKHCVGGVAGNRTTMIVIPIVAAAGYSMIKTSSRSITSPAGTADTMEVIAPVTLSKEQIKKVIQKTNACMVWGGTFELASADDIIINIERTLSLDPRGMLLASIMAKKKAVGATHVLIDVPYGRGAKLANKKDAKTLKKQFTKLGARIGIKTKVILTDGSQPVGNGIGPLLEARDVLSVLSGGGPEDLRKKAVYMAAQLLKLAGHKHAEQTAMEMLESGKALKKFKQIAIAQGGKNHLSIAELLPGKYHQAITAKKNATITHIDNKRISKAARIAGAPKDKRAGIYLHAKKGSILKKGDIIYTIFAENPKKLEYALEYITSEPFIEFDS